MDCDDTDCDDDDYTLTTILSAKFLTKLKKEKQNYDKKLQKQQDYKLLLQPHIEKKIDNDNELTDEEEIILRKYVSQHKINLFCSCCQSYILEQCFVGRDFDCKGCFCCRF